MEDQIFSSKAKAHEYAEFLGLDWVELNPAFSVAADGAKLYVLDDIGNPDGSTTGFIWSKVRG